MTPRWDPTTKLCSLHPSFLLSRCFTLLHHTSTLPMRSSGIMECFLLKPTYESPVRYEDHANTSKEPLLRPDSDFVSDACCWKCSFGPRIGSVLQSSYVSDNLQSKRDVVLLLICWFTFLWALAIWALICGRIWVMSAARVSLAG